MVAHGKQYHFAFAFVSIGKHNAVTIVDRETTPTRERPFKFVHMKPLMILCVFEVLYSFKCFVLKRERKFLELSPKLRGQMDKQHELKAK